MFYNNTRTYEEEIKSLKEGTFVIIKEYKNLNSQVLYLIWPYNSLNLKQDKQTQCLFNNFSFGRLYLHRKTMPYCK